MPLLALPLSLFLFAYPLPGAMLFAHYMVANYVGEKGSVRTALAVLSAAPAAVGMWLFGANLNNVADQNDASAGAIGLGIMLLFLFGGIACAATATFFAASSLVSVKDWDRNWLRAAGAAALSGWAGAVTGLSLNFIPSLIAMVALGVWWAGAAYRIYKRAPELDGGAKDPPPIPPSP